MNERNNTWIGSLITKMRELGNKIFNPTPILLFPLRLETRWETIVKGGIKKQKLKIRWYPDTCQLTMDHTDIPRDSFADITAFAKNGFEMKAMPDKIILYTLGFFGGLEKVTEVRISYSNKLRFRWHIDKSNPKYTEMNRKEEEKGSLKEDTSENEKVNSAWVTDFDEAVKCGMGVVIEDPSLTEQIASAEWLIAFGFGCEDQGAVQKIFEYFINRNEFKFLEQGEPTNNTSDERVRAFGSDTVSRPQPHLQNLQTNAEIFSKYICPSFLPSDIANVQGGLSISQSELSKRIMQLLCVEKHASISPRGHFPSIRIGDNPYGIALTYPSRRKSKKWLPGISLARIHGRTVHEPDIDADSKYAIFIYYSFQEGDVDIIAFQEELRQGRGIDIKINAQFSGNTQKTVGNIIPALDKLLVSRELATTAGIELPKPGDVIPDIHYKDNIVTMSIIKLAAVNKAILFENYPKGLNPKDPKRKDIPWVLSSESEYERLNAAMSQNAVSHAYYTVSDEGYLQQNTAPTDFGAINARKLITSLRNIVRGITDLKQELSGNILEDIPKIRTNLLKKEEKAKYLENLDFFEKCINSQISEEEFQSLLIETVDAYSNRFDVWFSLDAFLRLDRRIGKKMGVGVFGWIERPMRGSAPEGAKYYQAPSLDQGKAVAALGSVNTSQGSNYHTNLSSDRVSDALEIIEGLRTGVSLSEIFGYRVERMLHEDNKGKDIYINPLKTIIPYKSANVKTSDSASSGQVLIGIIDGEKFLEISDDPNGEYLKRLAKDMNKKPDDVVDDLKGIRNRIANYKDAFLDLAYSEIAYQHICNNQAKVNAWLDVADGKALPPDPDFIRTQRTGRKITQQAIVMFEPANEKDAISISALMEPNWKEFCARFAEPICFKIVVSKIASPEKTFEVSCDTECCNVPLNELFLNGKKQLLNIKEILLFRRLKNSQEILDCLINQFDLKDMHSISDVINQLDVKIMMTDEIEFSKLQRRYSGIIKNSKPINAGKYSRDELANFIAIITDRVKVLKDRIGKIKLWEAGSFDDYITEKWQDLQCMAAFTPRNTLKELFLSGDQASMEAVKSCVVRKVDDYCDQILRYKSVIFKYDNPAITNKDVKLDVRYLSLNGASDDRLEEYVFRFVSYVYEAYQDLLSFSPSEGKSNVRSDAAEEEVLTLYVDRSINAMGRFMFLPPIQSVDAVISNLCGDNSICATDIDQRRHLFYELAKTIYVRDSMANLYGIQNSGQLLKNYKCWYGNGEDPERFGISPQYTHCFYPDGPKPSSNAVGFMVDSWVDFIPNSTETTALVVNYDAPSAEAPNALIMCAPPVLGWTNRKMAKSLANVLDIMRLRTLSATEVWASPLASEFKKLRKKAAKFLVTQR